MGLLDIWSDWKRDNQGTVQDDFSGMNSDAMSPNLNTAGGIDNPSYRRKESPLIKNPIFPEKYVPPGQGKIVLNPDGTNKVMPNEIQMFKPENQTQGTLKGEMPTDPITQGGTGVKLAEDQGFLSKLSGMAGVDMDKAAANWKDKGGFEGLMSNPAFSLGLALMQSSANGKTINQGILDNFVKSAKISSEFKDRIEARKQEPIQATAGDVTEVKDLLKTMNVDDPSLFEKLVGKFKGENVQAMFDMASEDIANALQIEMAAMQKNNKTSKPLVFDTRLKIKILKRLEREGKIKKKGGTFFTKSTLETDEKIKTRAQGGPVTQGEPYLVGEKGPEIIIPNSNGNVLTNDDSQIYSMLLASNPQLQKVSKQRAEKILRNRFPEYFEG